MSIVKDVKQRIEKAKQRAEKDQDVTLIAVTKKQPLFSVNEVIELGIEHIAENRVKDLAERFAYITGQPKVHFIGHLQRNKVKDLLKLPIALIHSVDSVRLAKEIHLRAKEEEKVQPILIQVNIAKEDAKFGFYKEELDEVFEEIDSLENIKIEGLMMMAPFVDDPEDVREYFKQMKELFDYYRENNYNRVYMNNLSMGMTQDFEVAIEEGSTMVRIGTGLFPRRTDE